ncbi:MAG: anaerobic ribonucleoside-triphosphate reductase activating protein [Alphaproteobacteria bacterium]|nr:anaerobic ribonucleoside-triphosphate reductase activating protein [Alphaproteobacteria bacterium]MBQ3946288.1 anaerobic ribonucleoside-triphosphate reductase activating protein [Alphaproteobacteria bacterium]
MPITNALKVSISIGAVLKFSTLDYPGKLSAVIFCQGCPNNCVYCHNPDFIPAKTASSINFDEVVNFLLKRQGLLEAVVFSGGDPLIQNDLYEAMFQIKSMGFLVGLHTSGVNPKRLKEILDITDWVGFDIKTTFEKYENITRNKVSAQLAQESLNIILKSNVAYEIRTTVDSRYITFEDLKGIAKSLKGLGIQKWVLQECILRSKSGEQKLLLPNIDEIEQLKQYLKVEIRRQ